MLLKYFQKTSNFEGTFYYKNAKTLEYGLVKQLSYKSVGRLYKFFVNWKFIIYCY